MKIARLLLLVSVFASWTNDALLAYVIPAATVQVVASADGDALLRIEPGEPREKNHPAQAIIYLLNPKTGAYEFLRKFALKNSWAPAKALIADKALYVVTFDDWPEMGHWPNTIVVYRGSGDFLKAWALEDIFTNAEIEAFGPFPVNSPKRVWRGQEVSLSGNSRLGPVVLISPVRPNSGEGLRLNLKDMAFNKLR